MEKLTFEEVEKHPEYNRIITEVQKKIYPLDKDSTEANNIINEGKINLANFVASVGWDWNDFKVVMGTKADVKLKAVLKEIEADQQWTLDHLDSFVVDAKKTN